MECKWHSGAEADLVCLKCGQAYCRECVKETREAHYCPDCHRESVERLAAQMGGRPREVKPPKQPKVKEPKVAKEKPVKEKKPDKKLRKPVERVMGPTLDDLGVAPPPPVEPPKASLTPEEKAAFWGDGEKVEKAAPFTPVQPKAAAPAAPRPSEPVHVQGMPPPLVQPMKPVQKAPPSPLAEPLVPPQSAGEPVKKRPIPTKEAREAAVIIAEGFPTAEALKKGGKRRGAKAASDALTPKEAGAEQSDEALGLPQSRMDRMRERKRERRAVDLPVAMQVPEDYDGEVTTHPSYIKAVLFGMAAGLITAGAFASLAWWVHKDLGIFGWVIGLCVGIAVAFGSGRHFSWKLGLIAAVIAMFFVSVERIGYFMLDVRFNDILPIKLGIWPLFRESFTTYLQSFWSIWLVFFIVSGAVAFMIAFRPPPIRLQISGQAGAPPRRVAGGGA